MSADGDRGDVAAQAEECRRTARALAPCARHDGGLTLTGSAAAALAELFRALARDGADLADVAERAARRVRADAAAAVDLGRDGAAAATVTTPAPRAPADDASEALAAR